MQAEGFLTRRERHPVALGTAVAINAAAVAALLLVKGDYVPVPPRIIDIINIPIEEPPPPEPAPIPPKAETPVAPPVPIPDPVVPIVDPIEPPIITARIDPYPIPVTTGLAGGGGGQGVAKADPAPPVLVAARVDPRYKRLLQPPYPPRLQRLEIEGRVVVKVLIGTDGRVKDVRIVYADDDGFADVTERQARDKWRFEPATRDGQPVESWKELVLRFEIARG